MNFYPPIGRKNMAVNSTFKGLSTLDPYQIAESYATVAKNLDADGYPAMKTRSPLCLFGTEVAYGNTTGIQGIFRYRNGAITELIAVAKGRIYKYSGTSWTELFNMSGLPNPTSPIATNDVYAANFVQGIVFSTGASPVMYLYNGSTVTSFTPAILGPSPTTFQNFVSEYKSRLFVAVGNQIFHSAIRLYNDWTSTGDGGSGSFNTDINDGEDINGMIAGNSRMIVFKPNNMYEIYGDSIPFSAVKVTDRLGAVNGKCMVNLDGVTYFMHTTGVYAYAGGRPRRISDNVVGYFNGWTDTKKKQAFVGTDGTRLFCNLGDDRMLVWNSEYNVWYEWTNFQARCMLSETSPMFGTTTDKIKAFEGIGLETNVAWEWVSKPINTGVLTQKWRINKLWLTLDTGLASDINVYITKSGGGSDWTLLRTITGTAQQQNVRVPINTGTAANAKVMRIRLTGNGACTVHEIVRESRIFPIV